MRRQLLIGSRRLSYLDTAAVNGAPPTGGTVLFLHAFPLQAEMWTAQLDALPPGWRGLAPDLRGFGQSGAAREPGQPPSIDDYARDALALLDALAVSEVVVVGLSMGGYVALALWRLACERMIGVVLADTKAGSDTPEARAGRDRMVGVLDAGGVAAVADEMLPRLLRPASLNQRPELVARVRALATGHAADGVRDGILRLRDRPDSAQDLTCVDRPALVIVGEDDGVTPVEEGRRMQEAIPGATLEVVEAAGHLSNLESPSAFNRALNGFLTAIRADRP